MTIDVTCPCGKQFRADPQLAGKRVKCRVCGNVFVVPRPEPEDSYNLADDDGEHVVLDNPAVEAEGHWDEEPDLEEEQWEYSEFSSSSAPRTRTKKPYSQLNLVPWLVAGFLVLFVAFPLLLVGGYFVFQNVPMGAERELLKQGFRPTSGILTNHDFYVRMPGAYKELAKGNESVDQTLASVCVTEDRNNCFFAFYMRANPRLTQPRQPTDEVFDMIQAGFVKEFHATHVRQRELWMGNVKGREVTLDGTYVDQKVEAKFRFFAKPGKIYVIAWAGVVGRTRPAAEVDDFLDSFEFTR